MLLHTKLTSRVGDKIMRPAHDVDCFERGRRRARERFQCEVASCFQSSAAILFEKSSDAIARRHGGRRAGNINNITENSNLLLLVLFDAVAASLCCF